MLIMHYQQAVEHHTSAQSCSYNDTICRQHIVCRIPSQKNKTHLWFKKILLLGTSDKKHIYFFGTFIVAVLLNASTDTAHRLTNYISAVVLFTFPQIPIWTYCVLPPFRPQPLWQQVHCCPEGKDPDFIRKTVLRWTQLQRQRGKECVNCRNKLTILIICFPIHLN